MDMKMEPEMEDGTGNGVKCMYIHTSVQSVYMCCAIHLDCSEDGFLATTWTKALDITCVQHRWQCFRNS